MIQQTASILYIQNINPVYDFTVSFLYKFDTDGEVTPVNPNYGFGVFFVTSDIVYHSGGGGGPGLGMVDTTNITPLSCITGLYFSIGFDVAGGYSRSGAPPYFATGLPYSSPLTITSRKDYTDCNFLSCIAPINANDALFSYDVYRRVRINVRKMFSTVTVDVLSGGEYVNVASFDTLILPNSLPSGLKFGISYSGATYFTIKDVTVNLVE